MRAATEGSLPPVMPHGNLVEVLGREVRQGSPGELMVESSPSRQRRPPCKTNKEMSDEAADAAALTYLLTYLLLLQCCNTKYLQKQVKQILTKSAPFADVLVALERQYPSQETNLSIRAQIQNLGALPNNPKPAGISELLADLDHWVRRLTPSSHGSDELLFRLVAKLQREVWDECQATAECKARALTYEDLSVLLLELALEKESDQHLNAYCPGGGGSGSHGRGYQGPRPGQGNTPKNPRFKSNVQDLFWCDARREQGCLLHAPVCDQRNCFVVLRKKQETNTGGKAKLPDHYRCTITCAFCGKRKHYEDEC